MVKYTYRTESPSEVGAALVEHGDLESWLDYMGERGWQLVAANVHGFMVFMKPWQ